MNRQTIFYDQKCSIYCLGFRFFKLDIYKNSNAVPHIANIVYFILTQEFYLLFITICHVSN